MVTRQQVELAKLILTRLESFLYAPAPQRSTRQHIRHNIDDLLPGSSIHATGIGLSRQQPGQLAFIIYKFEDSPDLLPADFSFEGHPVELDVLPRMQARPADKAQGSGAGIPMALAPGKVRPICGGASISPQGADYAGTLGGFVERQGTLYALSNNHVLANIDALPHGTPIAQPAHGSAEQPEIFATLDEAVPIKFPAGNLLPVNHFDVAWARITEPHLVSIERVTHVDNYNPKEVKTAVPGMRVVKMGQTTGLTRGTLHGVAINNVRINYGQAIPGQTRMAIFNQTMQIVGEDGQPFSLAGDSGSLVIEEATGHPVGLLFAGSGKHTIAFDLQAFCSSHGMQMR